MSSKQISIDHDLAMAGGYELGFTRKTFFTSERDPGCCLVVFQDLFYQRLISLCFFFTNPDNQIVVNLSNIDRIIVDPTSEFIGIFPKHPFEFLDNSHGFRHLRAYNSDFRPNMIINIESAPTGH